MWFKLITDQRRLLFELFSASKLSPNNDMIQTVFCVCDIGESSATKEPSFCIAGQHPPDGDPDREDRRLRPGLQVGGDRHLDAR